MTTDKAAAVYEVLSPWAEADPVPQRGLTADRPADLNGKTIGLFHMWKRASKPTLGVLERKIQEKYPGAKFSWYEESELNVPEIESVNKAQYEDWLKELDTVIYTYGD